jgi:hypothetical protein
MDIKIESTNKALSSRSGLVLANDLYLKAELGFRLAEAVPAKTSGVGRSLSKLKQLILGLVAGAECLDDWDRLSTDGGFLAACGWKAYTAKSFGDFLRSFKPVHCKLLNRGVVENAFSLREAIFGRTDSITIDLDSTSNEQYGKKMEGVVRNYKGINCLDTIQAFDEYGIQYWSDVRPGNTHTASGSLEIVHEIFSRMPKTENYSEMRRYLRADRGYCKIDLFNACMVKKVGFVIGLRQLMLRPLISRINEWRREDGNDTNRILFQGNRECEVGETVYQPKRSPNIFRVVAIRAVKVGRESQLIKGDADYDYYGWVTSIGYSEMSARRIVLFYRARGNAENFIREVKNGLDMHHYPCQKLTANRAFSAIGAFAYNILRFLALSANPKKPQFSKAIRFQLIDLPCQVICHAGEVIFRFMNHHFKEVAYWREKIKNLQLRFT